MMRTVIKAILERYPSDFGTIVNLQNKKIISGRNEITDQNVIKEYYTTKLANQFREATSKFTKDFKVEIGVGSGKWTYNPYIAIMDSKITTSPNSGYYIVYLFHSEMKEVFLSLNRGNGKLDLTKDQEKKISDYWKNLLINYAGKHKFNLWTIDIGAKTNQTKGYETRHIIGKSYLADEIPSDDLLLEDLEYMIDIYKDLLQKIRFIDNSTENVDQDILDSIDVMDRINGENVSSRKTDVQDMHARVEIVTKSEKELKATESSSEFVPDICGEDSKDLLNLSRDVRAIANLVSMKSTVPPLSIGLFGKWGSGKTFFMNQIKKEINNRLKKIHDSELENKSNEYFCNNIVQIEFNAWHYMDTNLWASLVTHIFEMIAFYISNGRNFEKGDCIKLEMESLYKKLQTSKEAYEKNKSNLDIIQERIKKIKDKIAKKEHEILDLKSINSEARKKIISNLKEEAKKEEEYFEVEIGKIDEIKDFCQEAKKIKKVTSIISNTLKAYWQDKTVLFKSLVCSLFLVLATVYFIPMLTEGAHGLLKLIVMGVIDIVPMLIPFKYAASKFNKYSDYIISLSEKQEQTILSEERKLEKEKIEIESSLTKQQQKIDCLQNEIQDIKSGRYLSKFIESRINSKIYSEQLGIINVIRRDFDSLSDYIKSIENNRRDNSKTPKKETKNEDILEKSNLILKEEILKSKIQNDTKDKIAAIEREEVKSKDEVASSLESQISDENKETDKNEGNEKYPVDRIVLYIDDLDRCSPKRVVEVLQAVHLLLSFELFVVILAVDTRWVSKCLQMEYKNMFQEELNNTIQKEVNLASTFDYLEKIIQIPVKINDMEDIEKENYIKGLFNLKKKINDNTHSDSKKPKILQSKNFKKDVSDMDGVESVEVIDDREDTENENNSSNELLEVEYDELIISEEEEKDIFLFLPILGNTPRTLKRFVNTYRLLKASGKIFDNYRIESLFVLSIIIGLQSHADSISRIIFESTESEKIENLIEKLLEKGNSKLDEKLDELDGLSKITKLKEIKDIPLLNLKHVFTQINKYSFY
jgi:hypothetical protein